MSFDEETHKNKEVISVKITVMNYFTEGCYKSVKKFEKFIDREFDCEQDRYILEDCKYIYIGKVKHYRKERIAIREFILKDEVVIKTKTLI